MNDFNKRSILGYVFLAYMVLLFYLQTLQSLILGQNSLFWKKIGFWWHTNVVLKDFTSNLYQERMMKELDTEKLLSDDRRTDRRDKHLTDIERQTGKVISEWSKIEKDTCVWH